jgi:hypothetical protein
VARTGHGSIAERTVWAGVGRRRKGLSCCWHGAAAPTPTAHKQGERRGRGQRSAGYVDQIGTNWLRPVRLSAHISVGVAWVGVGVVLAVVCWRLAHWAVWRLVSGEGREGGVQGLKSNVRTGFWIVEIVQTAVRSHRIRLKALLELEGKHQSVSGATPRQHQPTTHSLNCQLLACGLLSVVFFSSSTLAHASQSAAGWSGGTWGHVEESPMRSLACVRSRCAL